MKSVIKTILFISVIAFAFEAIALVINSITQEQFINLIEKTGLIILILLVLGLVLNLFNNEKNN